MKAIKMGLALAVASALVVPAVFAHGDGHGGKSAKEFDVCVNGGTAALNDNGDGAPFTGGDVIAAVGMMLPSGTINPAAPDMSCASYAGDRVGTFFAHVIITLGVGAAEPDDLAYVNWQFRVDGRGAFDTSGPVKIRDVGGMYPQTITGGTGRYKGAKGTLKTTVLAPGGFLIRVTLPNDD